MWTDLHSVGAMTLGSTRESRSALQESLRDDEMSCASVQRAYKDKISKRKRHISYVSMGKQTGRSSAVRPLTADLDYTPLWTASRPRTARVHYEMKRTASDRIKANSLDTDERHVTNVSPWLDTLRSPGTAPERDRGRRRRGGGASTGGSPGRPSTAPDYLRTDLSSLSTHGRPVSYVKMARQTERPDINPKYAYGHIAHSPKWDLTERSVLHTSHVHAKSAPRFAGSATGTTNAYWLSNTGVATINQARNGVTPAIIRPNYRGSPKSRFRKSP